MRVAIVGAGLSGLAAAWHLLQIQGIEVTIFDPCGIGGGASGVAAGLMHPYAGLHAKRNWHGLEGYQAAVELLAAAGPASSAKTGLLRLAPKAQNIKDFQASAGTYAEVEWLSAADSRRLAPGCGFFPGIFIKSAVTVYGSGYLKGLWQACAALGGKLKQVKVDILEDLAEYDKIAVTAGSETASLVNVPLFPVKGQLLELAWPAGEPPLTLPITSQVYLLMCPGNNTCLAGATYEHIFTDSNPDWKVAANLIMPKVIEIFPALEGASIVDVRAGIRASTPDHRPLLKQVDKRTWVLAGMGSKGLLYHALFGKQLASFMTAD